MKTIVIAVPDSPDVPAPDIEVGAILRFDPITTDDGTVIAFRVLDDDGAIVMTVPASSVQIDRS